MIIKWDWDFGDGTFSTESSPKHVYRMSGLYTIRLTVTSDLGATTTIIRTEYIRVREADVHISGLPLRRTNKILRFANKITQGIGWSVFTGAYPKPETRINTLKIFDANNQIRMLVPNSENGKYVEIGTRNGPAGSGLAQVWKDMVGEYGGGANIASIVDLKEHLGSHEHYLIEHQESHTYFRPYDEDLQGASGYDASGYPTGIAVDVSIYKNGALSQAAITKNIPKTGDLVFDRKVEANRLKIRIATDRAPWKLVRTEQYYLMKNIAGNTTERRMSEHLYQEAINNNLVFWMSRGGTPLLNRWDGGVVGGSYFATTKGPDGQDGTGLVFSPIGGLNDVISSVLTGDFTIIFWMRNVTTPLDIFEIPANTVILDVTEVAPGTYTISFSDLADSSSQDLNWNGTDWIAIKITRKDTNLTISANGILLNTFPLIAVTSYDRAIRWMWGESGELGNDLRIYSTAISDDAFAYYYDDFINNNGDSTCPNY